MLLIGLGHKAKNGKDTFASAVKAAHPHLDIRLLSFADPLRAEVTADAKYLWKKNYGFDSINNVWEGRTAIFDLCRLHGVPYDASAISDAQYPWGKQRALYQWWGTEYRRAQDPDYWNKKATILIDQAQEDLADAVIFRDMRFHNEYRMLGERGGWRIKVSRLGWASDVPEHVSETELDDMPFDLHLGVGDNLPLLEALSVQTFRTLLEHSHRKELLAS